MPHRSFLRAIDPPTPLPSSTLLFHGPPPHQKRRFPMVTTPLKALSGGHPTPKRHFYRRLPHPENVFFIIQMPHTSWFLGGCWQKSMLSIEILHVSATCVGEVAFPMPLGHSPARSIVNLIWPCPKRHDRAAIASRARRPNRAATFNHWCLYDDSE